VNEEILRQLLDKFKDVRVAVVGDIFLDDLVFTNSSERRESEENQGEPVYIIDRRESTPGVAGTITNNLSALGVGNIYVVTVIGDDGNGAVLRKGLEATRVDTSYAVVSNGFKTWTYHKLFEDGKEVFREDTMPRQPLPAGLEEGVIANLRALVPQVDGVIISDQVVERNYGVITDKVRAEIAVLAAQYGDKIFFADSRVRIGKFEHVMIKPNECEAANAIEQGRYDRHDIIDRNVTQTSGSELYERTHTPVFLTVGNEGALLFYGSGYSHIHGLPVRAIDITGAGDSFTAGAVPTMCLGAGRVEAAQLGVLVSSVTVTKKGTGTASPEEVLGRYREFKDLFMG